MVRKSNYSIPFVTFLSHSHSLSAIGLLPNSYFSKDLQGKVYDICDPRSKFSSVPPQGQAADRWDSRTEGTKGDWGFSHASSGQVTKAVGDGGLSSSSAANTISVSNQTHFNVPHMYQKISSRTSVKSLQQFHYSSFNVIFIYILLYLFIYYFLYLYGYITIEDKIRWIRKCVTFVVDEPCPAIPVLCA